MTYTPEQLESMSDYEINCAIGDKKGLTHCPNHPMDNYNDNGQAIFKNEFMCYAAFDGHYCFRPEHYMPIAIEHGISIEFCTITNTAACSFLSMELTKERLTRPKHETGRAVCECFLLMDITL